MPAKDNNKQMDSIFASYEYEKLCFINYKLYLVPLSLPH